MVIKEALVRRGLAVEEFDASREHLYRALVVVKRYDDETLAVVRRLRSRGVRTVLDLYDNHFMVRAGSIRQETQARVLRQLVQEVDRVVVCSGRLSEVVLKECPRAAPITVIGDPPDNVRAAAPPRWTSIKGHVQKARLLFRAHQPAPVVTELVWFGGQGGARATVGLPDIAALIPALEALHMAYSLRLTVISDSRARYRSLFTRARFPHRYFSWNPITFERLLAECDIALIPATRNEFTECKSDNRIVTALNAGLAVVASPLPAYVPWADAVQLGDIPHGLEELLRDPGKRERLVKIGRTASRHRVRLDPIVDAWERALDSKSYPAEGVVQTGSDRAIELKQL